jgi:hypothetical protein
MTLGYRVLSCLALLGMTIGALSQYRPAWAAQFSLDWWTIPELIEQMHRHEQQQAERAGRRQTMFARLSARGKIVQELLAKRLTLVAAAEQFRALYITLGEASEGELSHFSGATEAERLCRQVISWAENAARVQSPDTAPLVRQCLESELMALLTQGHGSIALSKL